MIVDALAELDASTLAEYLAEAIAEAFTAQSRANERDPHHVGLSAVGRCRRRNAYALAGTEISDEVLPGESRAANLGRWEHEGLLPALAKVLPGEQAEIERTVTLKAAGRRLDGHIDVLWGPLVADLKTVGEYRLGRAQDGPFVDHRLQVGAYALAARQEGLPVRWLAWIYLDRASGNERLHVEPFTNKLGLAVVDRITEINGHTSDPDGAPRDGRGPGLDLGCDSCPWLRRCWGDDAAPGETGAQATLLGRDGEAVMHALAVYADTRNKIKELRDDQEFARAIFTGSTPGTYGKWRWYQSRDGEELDVSAAVKRLEELGEKLPMRRRAGALQVRPARS